jgi:membrane glycosyltransferase
MGSREEWIPAFAGMTKEDGRASLTARRLVFFSLLLVTAVTLTMLMASLLAPGGWTLLKAAILVAFIGVAPWIGVCVGNAVPGLLILLFARNPARAVLPVRGDIESAPITARTAIAVTVRNENMQAVLASLLRLLNGLADCGDRFGAFVLSDSDDAHAAAEEAAIAGFPLPLGYRRRAENTGFKAGNVMDFFDHHAAGFEFALMLDADSAMSAEAVVGLVRIMQAAPRLGIVQHLTVGRPAAMALPRLFQFGMRAGMRVWATGQAWWQGADGPYWGHNAVIRIAAFREHARLPKLADGSFILSHDQVEAARLTGAGWGVAVWASEEGSQEANPPALPEFLHRDARWLVGNLQYLSLLRAPGFSWMGRWQLAQAILLMTGAPLYTFLLLLAAVSAATGGGEAFPRGRMLALTLAWTVAIYAPKLCGYVQVLLEPRERRRYGGGVRFVVGAVCEFGFTLLLDAITQVSKTVAAARFVFDARPAWRPQNRSDRGVRWGEAGRMLWPHTVFGVVVFGLLACSSWVAVAWALPFAGGLLAAIPFCVLTSSPGVSGWLRRLGIAATPEEVVDGRAKPGHDG